MHQCVSASNVPAGSPHMSGAAAVSARDSRPRRRMRSKTRQTRLFHPVHLGFSLSLRECPVTRGGPPLAGVWYPCESARGRVTGRAPPVRAERQHPPSASNHAAARTARHPRHEPMRMLLYCVSPT